MRQVCLISQLALAHFVASWEIGLGCAVAIALDATLVRLILVPATMQLMGRWNWWLPAWLDKRLPELGFERDDPAFEQDQPDATAPANA